MLCSNCKAPINPDSKFCGKCGQKTPKSEQAKNSNPQQSSPGQQNGGSMAGKIMLLIGIVALLAGGWGVLRLYSDKTSSGSEMIASIDSTMMSDAEKMTTAPAQPEAEKEESPNAKELTEVVEGQLNAIKDGDIQKAYNDFVSKEFREATPFDAFQQFIKSLPILNKSNTVKVLETTEEAGKGFVVVSLVNEPGKQVLIEYTLTKEDDKWRVQGFRVDQFEEAEMESTEAKPQDSTEVKPESVPETQKDSNKPEDAPKDLSADITRPDVQPALEAPSASNEVPSASVDTEILENHPEIGQAVTTIEDQLNALRDHNVRKAYQDFTTKEFQQATSLEQYQEAIKDFPLLSDNESVNYDYTHATLDRDHVTIPVTLHKGNKTLQMDVALIKSGNDWKIWGTEIKDNEPLAAAETTAKAAPRADRTQDEKDIKEVVEGQLKALRDKDLKKAYDDYVSPEFMKATPFAAFEDFIKQYPILNNHKTISLGDVTFADDKASVVAILQTNESSNPIEYSLVKSDGHWKVYGFRLLVSEQTALSNADKGMIIALINDQFEAIKNNDIKKAYEMTAQEFRQATPEGAFGDFIKNYPVFHQYTSTTFSNAQADQNSAVIVITLNSPEQSTDVEYRLAKEKDAWKIWSMSVTRNTSLAARPPSINSAELVKIIEDQLTAIRDQNLKKAYEDYASTGFKEATSEQTFEDFVHKNPVLSKNKTFVLGNFNYENDIGTIDGTLTSAEDEKEQVKYRLVYEDKKWKILSLNILYTLKANAQAMQLSKVEIGTQVDPKGLVTNPTTTLQAGNDKITVNVHVLNGTKGTNIEAVLEHVESSSKVAPVSTTLDRDGNSIVSFAFSPPRQGWPKGHYKLHITTSTGVEDVAEFVVE